MIEPFVYKDLYTFKTNFYVMVDWVGLAYAEDYRGTTW